MECAPKTPAAPWMRPHRPARPMAQAGSGTNSGSADRPQNDR